MHAGLTILETFAIDLLDAAAIMAFLLVGLVCIALIDRKIAEDLAPQPARRMENLPVLLERLTLALKSYRHGLLTQNPGRFLSWLASIASVASGMVAFAALSFGPAIHLAKLNAGLIFIFATSFLGICGGVLARGFSVRSGSLAGIVRNAMQLASFEGASALALISGVILAGSLSVGQIVNSQLDQGAWFIFLAPLGFVLYLASSIAGIGSAARPLTRRLAERAENEFGGMQEFRWPFGSLGASIHLLIGAGLVTTVFGGGWLRPFASYHDHFAGTPVELLDALPPLAMAGTAVYFFWLALFEENSGRKQLMNVTSGVCATLFAILTGVLFASPAALEAVHGAFWFVAKMAAYIYGFLWLRARIPQFRFGRPIRAAWNFLIPLSTINLVCVAGALVAREQWNWSPAGSIILATAIVAAMGIWLGLRDISETQTFGLDANGREQTIV
jgi:NADH-quinone oxidoreductase subunit H